MTEELSRLCDCGACCEPLGRDPWGSENAPGGFCSWECASHAGGELRVAQAEHRGEQ